MLLSATPEPATPIGLNGEPLPIELPPVAAVYHEIDAGFGYE